MSKCTSILNIINIIYYRNKNEYPVEPVVQVKNELYVIYDILFHDFHSIFYSQIQYHELKLIVESLQCDAVQKYILL